MMLTGSSDCSEHLPQRNMSVTFPSDRNIVTQTSSSEGLVPGYVSICSKKLAVHESPSLQQLQRNYCEKMGLSLRGKLG